MRIQGAVMLVGQVALTMKVMPDGPEVDINGLKKRIESVGDVRQIIEKPIGFGLVLLEVLLVFDDKVGGGDFEAKIRELKGVGSVEAGDITLI